MSTTTSKPTETITEATYKVKIDAERKFFLDNVKDKVDDAVQYAKLTSQAVGTRVLITGALAYNAPSPTVGALVLGLGMLHGSFIRAVRSAIYGKRKTRAVTTLLVTLSFLAVMLSATVGWDFSTYPLYVYAFLIFTAVAEVAVRLCRWRYQEKIFGSKVSESAY